MTRACLQAPIDNVYVNIRHLSECPDFEYDIRFGPTNNGLGVLLNLGLHMSPWGSMMVDWLSLTGTCFGGTQKARALIHSHCKATTSIANMVPRAQYGDKPHGKFCTKRRSGEGMLSRNASLLDCIRGILIYILLQSSWG